MKMKMQIFRIKWVVACYTEVSRALVWPCDGDVPGFVGCGMRERESRTDRQFMRGWLSHS